MGLPKDVAMHAMVRDQLDPNISDMDPEKLLKSQTESADGRYGTERTDFF